MVRFNPLAMLSGLFKDWKPLAVIIVLFWSLSTAFQIRPEAEVKDWQHLSNVPPDQITAIVMERLYKHPRLKEMNLYEREHWVKTEQEKALLGNNIQIIEKFKSPFDKVTYVIFTNLRLGLDLRGGSQLLLRAMPAPPQVPEITPEVMRGVETVINNRINSLGVAETVVQRAGKDRLIVELPGIKDPQQAKDRLGTTAMLEFKELLYDETGSVQRTATGAPMWKDCGLTGADFKQAQATPMVSGAGSWRVSFEFKDEGARKFGALTQRLVGKQIGIFLDGEPTDRTPEGRPVSLNDYSGVTVREPITGGRGEITGNFTKEQAVDLSLKLNAGALPVPVTILEERTVGATLGQDSISKSLLAGLIGIAIVMLFMLVVYGLSGMVANLALVLYTVATMAVFIAIPVTLTLAGIAGFILSIGMAVDANILIFERTKEELDRGKNLYVAIETGFSKAFSAIFDSNANSMIACAVLLMFGTPVVKGFAVTLAIGVALSMFTAISATRTMLHLIPRKWGLFGHRYDRPKKPQVPSKEAV